MEEPPLPGYQHNNICLSRNLMTRARTTAKWVQIVRQRDQINRAYCVILIAGIETPFFARKKGGGRGETRSPRLNLWVNNSAG